MQDGTGPAIPKELKRTTSMSKKVAKAGSAARKALTSPLRRRPSAKGSSESVKQPEKAIEEVAEVSTPAVDVVATAPSVATAMPADFAPSAPKEEEKVETKPKEPAAPVLGVEVPPTIVEMVAELEKELSSSSVKDAVISSPKATATAVVPVEKMDLHPLLRMLFKVTCTEMCFTEVEPVKALPAAVNSA